MKYGTGFHLEQSQRYYWMIRNNFTCDKLRAHILISGPITKGINWFIKGKHTQEWNIINTQ